MPAEELIRRVGVSEPVMAMAAEDDARIRSRRERLVELCLQDRELALEQRLIVREHNRTAAASGAPLLAEPQVPNYAAELEIRLPQLFGKSRQAPRPQTTAPASRLPLVLDEQVAVVYGFVCPWGERTRVADTSRGVPYTEELPAGSVEIPKRRLPLVVEYDDEPVGVSVGFRTNQIGLYGWFELRGRHGTQALALIRSGFLGGFGPVFTPLKTRQEGGLVVRERVRLEGVAVCRYPAYRDAWIREATG